MTTSPTRQSIAALLAEARELTIALIAPLGDELLNKVYSELLSPLAWDLGHIANFEELWLVQTVGGRTPLHGELGHFYDAIENPRKERGELPILRDEDLRAYMSEVRARTLAVLEEVDVGPDNPTTACCAKASSTRCLSPTSCSTRRRCSSCCSCSTFPTGPPRPIPSASRRLRSMATAGRSASRRAPMRSAPPSAASPTTTSAPATRSSSTPSRSTEPRSPTARTSPIMEETGAEPPMYWTRDGDGWARAAMGVNVPVDPARPVVHVSQEEAEAFAGWAGKRLPTEFEWEAAAPQLEGVGGVWEWTSSDFLAYPGFEAFPYDEYSKVFFGDTYKVLRGASWATHPHVARPSFRNWDLPQRRQIFAGIRLARWRSRMTIAIDVHLPADQAAAMERDVREGLATTPKELSPKYFYDERGSQLFEDITELEEYYPTRRERQILEERSAEIVAAAGNPATLIELGSGSASKTRHLLDAMRDAGSLQTYVPVDISEEITRQTASALVEEYPGLDVHGLVCDFEAHLERTPTTSEAGPRLIAFLGGTIGNLYPDERAAFLSRICSLLDTGDHLLLGTDLVKDTGAPGARLRRPGRGHRRIQQERPLRAEPRAGRGLRPRRLRARRRFDAVHEWIDIGLRSLVDQESTSANLDLTVHFDAGEILRTEISTKFTRPRLEESYAGTGLALARLVHRPGRGLRPEPRRRLAVLCAHEAQRTLAGEGVDQLGELLRRDDGGEDRGGDAAGDELLEALLHLLGAAEDEHLLDRLPGRFGGGLLAVAGVPGVQHRLDLLPPAEPSVELGVDRDGDVGGEHEAGERLDLLARTGEEEEAAEELEALRRALDLLDHLGQPVERQEVGEGAVGLLDRELAASCRAGRRGRSAPRAAASFPA